MFNGATHLRQLNSFSLSCWSIKSRQQVVLKKNNKQVDPLALNCCLPSRFNCGFFISAIFVHDVTVGFYFDGLSDSMLSETRSSCGRRKVRYAVHLPDELASFLQQNSELILWLTSYSGPFHFGCPFCEHVHLNIVKY